MERLFEAVENAVINNEINHKRLLQGVLIELEDFESWARDNGLESEFLFEDEKTTEA